MVPLAELLGDGAELDTDGDDGVGSEGRGLGASRRKQVPGRVRRVVAGGLSREKE